MAVPVWARPKIPDHQYWRLSRSLQGPFVTQALRGTQKKAVKTAGKQVKKASSQVKGRTKKASGGSGTEWYGPGRPGFLGEPFCPPGSV